MLMHFQFYHLENYKLYQYLYKEIQQFLYQRFQEHSLGDSDSAEF